jgi:hypothetical protein
LRFRGISSFFALILSSMTIAIATPAQAIPTVSGLWHMDESVGTTLLDASGLGNDGVATTISFVKPGFDGAGGAYSFNGVSKVVIPNSPSLNPGTADIVLTVHVKTSVLPGPVGDYDILRKKQNGQIYKMEIINSGQAYCQFKGTLANGVVKGGGNVVDGQWHKIVCAKSASQVSLTVDGLTVATKTITVGSISNTIGVYLGRKPDGTDAYTGWMDEASIEIG